MTGVAAGLNYPLKNDSIVQRFQTASQAMHIPEEGESRRP
jgi:hypothetical protein